MHVCSLKNCIKEHGLKLCSYFITDGTSASRPKERPYVTFRNKIRVLYVRYRKNNACTVRTVAPCPDPDAQSLNFAPPWHSRIFVSNFSSQRVAVVNQPRLVVIDAVGLPPRRWKFDDDRRTFVEANRTLLASTCRKASSRTCRRRSLPRFGFIYRNNPPVADDVSAIC